MGTEKEKRLTKRQHFWVKMMKAKDKRKLRHR